jgi:hypothetical protein
MPVFSYLAYPVSGSKEQLIKPALIIEQRYEQGQ